MNWTDQEYAAGKKYLKWEEVTLKWEDVDLTWDEVFILLEVIRRGGGSSGGGGGGSQGSGPSVPFLPTSNPDNFLVLYSRMVYNIVDG